MNAILKEKIQPLKITLDINQFNFYQVEKVILQEIEAIRSGVHKMNHYIKCSCFNLTNNIHMALRGELFHGYGIWNIQDLSTRMTSWLYSQIIEINLKNKNSINSIF